jgi:hypothetical protein
VCAEQVHDFATADPFVGFHDWIWFPSKGQVKLSSSDL